LFLSSVVPLIVELEQKLSEFGPTMAPMGLRREGPCWVASGAERGFFLMRTYNLQSYLMFPV
ncbi:MAG TPA: hypothetical protein VF452_24795, partial [Candidatus Binatia bacterium]